MWNLKIVYIIATMNLKSLFLATVLMTASASLVQAAAPVQIWVSSDADQKYYQNMIEVYRQKVDKDFQAEIKSYGFTEMPDKLSIAVKSGINTPDIVQFDEIFFSLYLKGNVPFVDLTDRLAASHLSTGLLPQRKGLFTWKGRTYGIPQSLSEVVLWYRADVFQDLGISPNDINTWDKFEAVSKRIKTDSRRMIVLDWSYLDILLRQRGYDFFGSDGKLFPDSAIVAQTWQRIVNWSKNDIGMLPGQGGIFSPDFFANSVASNGILSIIGADWYGLDIIQNMDPSHKGKWRAMPLPVWTDSLSRGRRNTSSFSGQGLVIFKKSQQVDRCWKFIDWVMTDVDANVQRYLQGNSFPCYRPAWTDMRFARPEPYFGNQNLAQLLTDGAPGMPFTTQSPLHAMVVNFLREQYFNDVVRGGSGTTVEQAMSGIQQQIKNMTSGKKPDSKP